MAGNVHQKVWKAIKRWTPEKKYRTEKKYQNELARYLDSTLNSSGLGSMLSLGDGTEYIVSTERGRSRADIVVNDTVAIEQKQNFTRRQADRLRGQLQRHIKEHEHVIACTCGLKDKDEWRRIEKDFSGGLLKSKPVTFIVKGVNKQTSRDQSDSGLFGGEPMFGGGGLDEPTNLDVNEDLDVDIDDPFE